MTRTSNLAALGAVVITSLAVAGTASAAPTQVSNYGQCVRDGFPYNQQGFGPITTTNFDVHQAPGISAFGPAEKPSGQIGCAVAPPGQN